MPSRKTFPFNFPSLLLMAPQMSLTRLTFPSTRTRLLLLAPSPSLQTHQPRLVASSQRVTSFQSISLTGETPQHDLLLPLSSASSTPINPFQLGLSLLHRPSRRSTSYSKAYLFLLPGTTSSSRLSVSLPSPRLMDNYFEFKFHLK